MTPINSKISRYAKEIYKNPGNVKSRIKIRLGFFSVNGILDQNKDHRRD